MPRDEIMAWCYVALMSLAIAGVLIYKWTRPPCHTESREVVRFASKCLQLSHITLLRLHSATKQ
jgi:hypothetical protein